MISMNQENPSIHPASKDSIQLKRWSMDCLHIYNKRDKSRAALKNQHKRICLTGRSLQTSKESETQTAYNKRFRQLWHNLDSETSQTTSQPKPLLNTTDSNTLSLTHDFRLHSNSIDSKRKSTLCASRLDNKSRTLPTNHNSCLHSTQRIVASNDSEKEKVDGESELLETSIPQYNWTKAFNRIDNTNYSLVDNTKQIRSNESSLDGSPTISFDTGFSDMSLPWPTYQLKEPSHQSKPVFRKSHSFDSYPSFIRSAEKASSTYGRRNAQDVAGAIWRRVEVWRERKLEVQREIQANNQIGQDIERKLRCLAKSSELLKFSSLLEDLEKITRLMLILSGSLATLENCHYNSCLAKDASTVLRKKQKVLNQIEEARVLERYVEQRSSEVWGILEQYLQQGDMQKYRLFLVAKTRLIVEERETEERIRVARQQLYIIQGVE